MKKSTFHITKMDCPSEERLIRMKLEGFAIHRLEFDIPNRKLEIYHQGDARVIGEAISQLNLNSSLINTEEAVTELQEAADHASEKRLLWTVLLINFGLFVLEIVSGFIAGSMGLVADSLDMLADAIVYALSLYAVGHIAAKKKSVAKISGYFQLALALFGLAEVLRRFFGFEEVPDFKLMIFISLLALTGNAISLLLLQKSKSKEAHIQASVIFTSNDVIVNIGVIIAGAAVYLTHSKYPDLIIGTVVFVMVVKGAFKILSLSK